MIRIMAYNIYKGGRGRLDDIAQVVRNSQPDILGVLEANGWGTDDQRTLRDFSATVWLPHYFFAKSNTEFDLALLSKYKPTSISAYQDRVHHSVIVAEFSFSGIGSLCIALLHLNPYTEDARIEEIKYITTTLAALKNKNTIVMGDFNMLSSHDPYDHQTLLATLKAQDITKFGEHALRFDVFRELEAAGYHDTMALADQPFTPTVPTPANADYAHAAPLRLDYIFVSQTLAPLLTTAQVITTPPTDNASDHYPLIADFAIPRSR